MADYIYNEFPNEPNDNENFFDDKPKRSADEIAHRRNNTLLIIVSAFFATILLLFVSIGMIMINKIDGKLSGKSSIDSLIFSSPTDQTPTYTPPSSEVSTPQSGEFGSISEVVYSVKDSVVEIQTTFNSKSSSAGSGVIIGSYKIDGIDAGYYIVTNAHVIQDENGNTASNIIIKTTDGKEYAVSSVRGIDSYGDIAVLMINTKDSLTGARFGNSNALMLGQEVIAIGNPLGTLGGSITNGIISALSREIEIDGNVYNLLQTNAAINAGNSGGGLFNMKGELVGIINAKSAGLGVEGIGFAIPSNDAKAVVEDIIEFGYAKGRPFLGITVSTISDSLSSSSYVYVHDLTKGYNDNNLQIQDIILSMNGVDVHTLNDFRAVLSKTKPGDTIEAEIKRGNEYITVNIAVYEKLS
jgi:serine protease Do